jgi:hypothetical protein
MKLSQKTEWILVAVLVAYLAFTPGFQIVKDALATPLGKAAALVGIVYVWKYVSAIVALLLLVGYMRCAKTNIWEMFSGAEESCTCEGEGYIWDGDTKICKNAEGKEGTVKTCVCANGYSWDGGEKGTKQCIPTSGTQPPVPPPTTNPVAAAMVAAPPTAAPAVAMGPVTSTAPMTTPGAAQAMATAAPPSMSIPVTGGVQPGAGSMSMPVTV